MNNLYQLIRLSIRSLMVHKLRSALSILGIICGVMAVLSMLSIGEGAKQEALNQIKQLGTNNIYLKAIKLTEEQQAKATEQLSSGLNLFDVNRIKKYPHIQQISYLKDVNASIIGMTEDITPQIVATSTDYARIQNLFVLNGRFITDQDIQRRNLVCVLGNSLAKSLGQNGWPGGIIRIENDLFRVVGVLKRNDYKVDKSSVVAVRNHNEMIFIPFGADRSVNQQVSDLNGSRSELSEIVIRVNNVRHVYATSQAIKNIMDTTHSGVRDYQIIVPQELLLQSQKTQRTFNIVLGSIAFISLLVGGIGIMNIMLATVSERTREIGIRRAVGASKQHIIIQFLAESVVLTLTGGIIGIATGIGGVWVITGLAGWKTAISITAVMLPLVMSIFVGIFFGLYPAYQAANLDPIAALRHE